jgi:hypothetical protein
VNLTVTFATGTPFAEQLLAHATTTLPDTVW